MPKGMRWMIILFRAMEVPNKERKNKYKLGGARKNNGAIARYNMGSKLRISSFKLRKVRNIIAPESIQKM
jgi:hypothetical protein